MLLAPKSTDYPYYAEFGWVGAANMPDDNSMWTQTSGGGTLAPGQPVTLTYDNGHGLVFTRTIAIDDKYMFTVSDSVANKGGAAVNLFPMAMSRARTFRPPPPAYVLHQGFVGVAGASEVDANYKDFKDPRHPAQDLQRHRRLGWHHRQILDGRSHSAAGRGLQRRLCRLQDAAGADAYQANYRLNARTQSRRAPAVSVTHRLFAGAKVVDILRIYQDQQNVSHFDLAVDWGWFWFLTRPFFWLLDRLYGLLGNFGSPFWP